MNLSFPFCLLFVFYIELNPKDKMTYYKRATANLRLRKFNSVINDLTTAIQVDSKFKMVPWGFFFFFFFLNFVLKEKKRKEKKRKENSCQICICIVNLPLDDKNIQTYKHTNIQTYKHTNKTNKNKHTNIQTYKHTNIQTYKQKQTKTNKNKQTKTNKHKQKQTKTNKQKTNKQNKKKTKKNKKKTKAYQLRAKVYKNRGSCAESKADFEVVVQLEPSDEVARDEIGKMQRCADSLFHARHFMAEQRWDIARDQLNAAVEAASESPLLMTLKAKCNYQLQDYQSVLADTM